MNELFSMLPLLSPSPRFSLSQNILLKHKKNMLKKLKILSSQFLDWMINTDINIIIIIINIIPSA